MKTRILIIIAAIIALLALIPYQALAAAFRINQIIDPVSEGLIYSNGTGTSTLTAIPISTFATGTNMWGGSLGGSIYNLNSGNVGIGTTTPYAGLTVSATTSAAAFHSIGLGTAAIPSFSFSNDQNTGVFSGGSDNLAVSTGGTSRWNIDSTDVVFTVPSRGANGTAAAPTYSFSGDTNNGLYYVTTDTIALSTGSSERLRISSAGNVGIGTTSPFARLDVRASSNGASSDAAIIDSSAAYEFTGSSFSLYGVRSAPRTSMNMFFNALNNYAFYGAPAGGATDWGFYITGEDRNFVSGKLGISTTTSSALFDVASTTGQSLFSIAPDGSVRFANDPGTDGYVLQSKGPAAAPQWVATSSLGIGGGSGTSYPSVGPQGYVQFASSTANHFDSSASFYWDSANSRLGLSTTSPQAKLSVAVTGDGDGVNIYNNQTNIDAASAGFNLFNNVGGQGAFVKLYSDDNNVNSALNNELYVKNSVGGMKWVADSGDTIGFGIGGSISDANDIVIQSTGIVGFGSSIEVLAGSITLDGANGRIRRESTGGTNFGFVNNQSQQISFNTTSGGQVMLMDGTDIYMGSGSNILNVMGSGNVGIGTTTPAARLSVAGAAGTSTVLNIASSTGSSLFAVDYDGSLWVSGDPGSSGYVLQSRGSGLSPQWVATSSLGIGGGSGTVGTSSAEIAGFLSRWTTSSGAPALLGNSILYDSGSALGLGTTSPLADFHIVGTSTPKPVSLATTTYDTAGSYTYNPPAGTFGYRVYMWGAGGSGEGRNSSSGSAGGGSGNYYSGYFETSTSSVTITVGAGGTGANGGGSDGGFSAFGSLLSACGGQRGGAGGGGVGGVAGAGSCGPNPVSTGTSGSGVSVGASVGSGGGSSAGLSGNGNNGAQSITGGTGSGGASAGTNGSGLDSGGGGNGCSGNCSGSAGGSPGAGGGGADGSGGAGGNGGAGKVVIVAYYFDTGDPESIIRIDSGTSTAFSINSYSEVTIGTTTSFDSALGIMNIASRFALSVKGIVGGILYVLESIDEYGNLYTGGPAPSASCSGAAVSGDSRTGSVTMSSANSCTLTFANIWKSTPVCMVEPDTNVTSFVTSESPSSVTFQFSSNTTGFTYICQAHQ